MKRVGTDAGFLLVEALVAAGLLALAATVIVGVSSEAIKASARELDETAAWSVMETLALELERFGKASPRGNSGVSVGPYQVKVVRLDGPDQNTLATHEIRAEATDGKSRLLALSLFAPGL